MEPTGIAIIILATGAALAAPVAASVLLVNRLRHIFSNVDSGEDPDDLVDKVNRIQKNLRWKREVVDGKIRLTDPAGNQYFGRGNFWNNWYYSEGRTVLDPELIETLFERSAALELINQVEDKLRQPTFTTSPDGQWTIFTDRDGSQMRQRVGDDFYWYHEHSGTKASNWFCQHTNDLLRKHRWSKSE